MLSLEQIVVRDLLCGKAVDDPAEEVFSLRATEQKPTMSLFKHMVHLDNKKTPVSCEINALASARHFEKTNKLFEKTHGVSLEVVGKSFALPLYSHGILYLGSVDQAKINMIFNNSSKFRKMIHNYMDAPAGYNMLLRYIRDESEIKYETLRDVHNAMKNVPQYDCVTVAKDEHAGYYCHPKATEEDCVAYKNARREEFDRALQPFAEEKRNALIAEFLNFSPKEEAEQFNSSLNDSRKAPYIFKGIYLG